MNNPLITVIVPIFKVEKYLRHCLDSILCQTYGNLEIILVDDESPDNCGVICDEYAAKDDRIIVIHQKNGGISAARNSALDIAKGDYIGFVDSDDWIEPTMYENLLKGFEVSDNVKISNGMIIREDETTGDSSPMYPKKWSLSENRLVPSTEFQKAMFSESSNHFVWSKLYARDVLSDVRFRVRRADNDTMYNFEVGRKMEENGWDMVEVPYQIYHYLRRAESVCTSRVRPQRLDRVANLDEILSSLSERPDLYHLVMLLKIRTLYWLMKDILNYKPWRKAYKRTYLPMARRIERSICKEALCVNDYRIFRFLCLSPSLYCAVMSLKRRLIG